MLRGKKARALAPTDFMPFHRRDPRELQGSLKMAFAKHNAAVAAKQG